MRRKRFMKGDVLHCMTRQYVEWHKLLKKIIVACEKGRLVLVVQEEDDLFIAASQADRSKPIC